MFANDVSNNAESGIIETDSRCMHKTITKGKENIFREFSFKWVEVIKWKSMKEDHFRIQISKTNEYSLIKQTI